MSKDSHSEGTHSREPTSMGLNRRANSASVAAFALLSAVVRLIVVIVGAVMAITYNAVVWLYSQFTSSARPLVVGERHGPATVGLSAGYPLDLGKAAEVRESPSQSQSSPMFGEPYRGLAEEQRGTEAIDAEEQPSGYTGVGESSYLPVILHSWATDGGSTQQMHADTAGMAAHIQDGHNYSELWAPDQMMVTSEAAFQPARADMQRGGGWEGTAGLSEVTCKQFGELSSEVQSLRGKTKQLLEQLDEIPPPRSEETESPVSLVGHREPPPNDSPLAPTHVAPILSDIDESGRQEEGIEPDPEVERGPSDREIAAKTNNNPAIRALWNANASNRVKEIESPPTPSIPHQHVSVEQLDDMGASDSPQHLDEYVMNRVEMHNTLRNGAKEAMDQGPNVEAYGAPEEIAPSQPAAAMHEMQRQSMEPVTSPESQLSTNISAQQQPSNGLHTGGTGGKKKKRGPIRGPLHKLMKELRRSIF